MVTTTTPLDARRLPENSALAPVPVVNPPPCSHTMTGRRLSSRPGVQTLRFRQSSSDLVGSLGKLKPGTGGVWGEIGPQAAAMRVPAHGLGGSAARHLPSPAA